MTGPDSEAHARTRAESGPRAAPGRRAHPHPHLNDRRTPATSPTARATVPDADRAADRVAVRRRTLAAAALLAVSLAAFAAVCAALPLPMADTVVYRAEGRAVAHGTDLYGLAVTHWQLPATYPPFAALLFLPLGWLSPPATKALFLLGNVAVLAWLVHLSLRFAGLPRTSRHRTPVLLAGTALALWLEPVYRTVVFGQINLVLLCLVLWDLGRPDGARGKGLAIGVAAGIKLTPGIFAVHLLLTGRVRAGLTALVGFAGTVVAGVLAVPEGSWDYFTRRLFETGRVGKAWIVDNQSLQGLVARLGHVPDPGWWWLVPAAVVGLAGPALARRLHLRLGWRRTSLLVTAGTVLLVSPISWSHHWVWCVPLLALLARTAVDGRGGGANGRTNGGANGRAGRGSWLVLSGVAVAVVFTARSLWLVPKHGDLDLRLAWWNQLPAAPYPLLALVLLAAVALSAARARDRAGTGVRRYSSDSDASASDASASEPAAASDPAAASASDPADSPPTSSRASTMR